MLEQYLVGWCSNGNNYDKWIRWNSNSFADKMQPIRRVTEKLLWMSKMPSFCLSILHPSQLINARHGFYGSQQDAEIEHGNEELQAAAPFLCTSKVTFCEGASTLVTHNYDFFCTVIDHHASSHNYACIAQKLQCWTKPWQWPNCGWMSPEQICQGFIQPRSVNTF